MACFLNPDIARLERSALDPQGLEQLQISSHADARWQRALSHSGVRRNNFGIIINQGQRSIEEAAAISLRSRVADFLERNWVTPPPPPPPPLVPAPRRFELSIPRGCAHHRRRPRGRVRDG